MTRNGAESDFAAVARDLVRRSATAALATLDPGGGPFVTLVTLAAASDGAPVLLLSGLARHTQNLTRDARCSLLVVDPPGDPVPQAPDPMAQTRATLSGHLVMDDDPNLRRRFLARHPAAAGYAVFTDFRIWRLRVESVHLVTGFGGGKAIAGADYPFPARGLEAAESTLLAEMDRRVILAGAVAPGSDAQTTRQIVAIDPEGFDIFCGAAWQRIAFDRPILEANMVIDAALTLFLGS